MPEHDSPLYTPAAWACSPNALKNTVFRCLPLSLPLDARLGVTFGFKNKILGFLYSF